MVPVVCEKSAEQKLNRPGIAGAVHFPGPGLPVARHEGVAVLVSILTVSIEVVVDFELKRAVQHSLSSRQAELIQSAPRFFPERGEYASFDV